MIYRSFVSALLLSVFFAWGCASAPAVSKKDSGPAEKGKPAPPASVEKKDEKKDEKKAEAASKYSRALMAMNHNRWKDAEKYLKESVELDPGSYNAHLFLGKIYLNKTEKLMAIDQFRKAIDLKKDAAPAYYELTGVYFDMGLPAEAAKVGEEALRNGVPEEVVSTDLGWAYYLAGDLEKAEARLRVAKKLLEKNTVPMNDLGLVLFTQGKYDEALENFQDASRINPKSTLAPYCAALTYKKLGKEDKALDALRDGLKKDPDLQKKAPAYNKTYFPRVDPGDLTPYFEKLNKEKQTK